ncbi:mucin, putative, partial [Trypanosoma cruzi]
MYISYRAPPLVGEASVDFIFIFTFFLVCVVRTFSALTVCACVRCAGPCGVAWLLRRVSVPSPAVCLSLCACVYAVHLPVLSLPCCVLSLCPLGAGPTGEFTPRATSEVHKAQVTMMLRRVLCVL